MTQAKRLLPHDWAYGALEAIATEGIDRLSVERLAKQLGVTKGSFYWHFTDRDALLVAAAETWEAVATTEVIASLGAIENPRVRLRQLFEVSLGDDERGPTDTALASHADHPVIGEIVKRVTRSRVAFLHAVFAELGFDTTAAANRARAAYASYLGHFTVRAALGPDHLYATTKADYLDALVDSLTT